MSTRWDKSDDYRDRKDNRREAQLRTAVIRMLLPLHAVAVENPALPGTPDVNYVEGWIELKCWGSWPKKSGTPLRIEHWTPKQRVFHVRRSRAGGETYVLIEIGTESILLEGGLAARILGTATRTTLYRQAIARWPGGKAELREKLLPLLVERQKLRAARRIEPLPDETADDLPHDDAKDDQPGADIPAGP